MTKPAFCKNHDVQSFILTSPRFAEAIERGEKLGTDEVIKLNICSYEKEHQYKIDHEFTRKFNLTPVSGEIMLRDREEREKK